MRSFRILFIFISPSKVPVMDYNAHLGIMTGGEFRSEVNFIIISFDLRTKFIFNS